MRINNRELCVCLHSTLMLGDGLEDSGTGIGTGSGPGSRSVTTSNNPERTTLLFISCSNRAFFSAQRMINYSRWCSRKECPFLMACFLVPLPATLIPPLLNPSPSTLYRIVLQLNQNFSLEMQPCSLLAKSLGLSLCWSLRTVEQFLAAG